jgi:GntR family transcriptional regulator, rspAB operon transcriptional repressor
MRDSIIAPPTPPSMKPRSTAQNIFELMRDDIVLGVLKPLDPIRESELADRLGVSRTPVREALLRLQSLGLVDIFPQSGTRVAPIRLEKVRAAQLIREAVEVEVVRHACRAATDDALRELGHMIEDQTIAARRNDLRRLFELDESFHRAIHDAAGLGSVAEELDDVKVHLNRLRFVSANWPRGADKVTEEHEEILAALKQRDEAAAAAAMRKHLRAVLPVLDRIARDNAQDRR